MTFSRIELMATTNGGPRYQTALLITKNTILATVETTETNIFTIRNFLKTQVEDYVSLIGFIFGYAYDVEIRTSSLEDLTDTRVFGIDVPALHNRTISLPHNSLVTARQLFDLYHGPFGNFLRRSLTDLNLAIKHSLDTPFYCFRAIESLRQAVGFSMKIDDEDRVKQWEALREVTQTTRDAIDVIREAAKPARHGLPNSISDEQRKACFLTTWEIAEKVIDFILRESGAKFQISQLSVDPP
jgi:hypothetical protein